MWIKAEKSVALSAHPAQCSFLCSPRVYKKENEKRVQQQRSNVDKTITLLKKIKRFIFSYEKHEAQSHHNYGMIYASSFDNY